MKKPFSAGINRRIRHYRRWKGTRRGGGQCPELSGAVLTDRDTTVVLVTPIRPEQSD